MTRSLKIVLGLLTVLLITVGIGMLLPDKPIEGFIGIAMAAPIAFGLIQTSDVAKQQRKNVWDQMETMIQLRKTEKREFTDEETKQFTQLRADYDKLDKMVDELEADERRALKMAGLEIEKRKHNNTEDKGIKRYSLKRALDLKVNNRALDGIELEMHQEAVKEARDMGKNIEGIGIPAFLLDSLLQKRAQSATDQTSNPLDQGGMAIATEKQGLIMALRPLLALSGLGATTMGGLVGNIDMVRGTSTAATWKGENAPADETSILTSKGTMSPKRLAAYGKISKQLLLQSEMNFEQIFINDLLLAIAQAVEAAAINGASGGASPVGVLNTPGIGSVVGGNDGLAMAWSHIVALEREVNIDNALMGSLGYLINAKVRAALKTTKLDAGSGLFLLGQDSKELNGYKLGVSNLVPSTIAKGGGANLSAAIFGDFSQLIIGQWGGLDLITDPYTAATEGQIKYVTNSFWDVFVKRPESFAAMVDIVTT